MNKKLELIEKDHVKKSLPEFHIGDQVKVHLKVQEDEKTRTQVFLGTVIKKRGSGIGASFTVLKDVRGDMVQKTFPVHSPNVEKVTVVLKGKAKRAKLYHLMKKKQGQ